MGIDKRLLKDPEVVTSLEELEPEYEVARELIRARSASGMSHKELADKMGTRQSNISRTECGEQNVSIRMLRKVAVALGKKVHVRLD